MNRSERMAKVKTAKIKNKKFTYDDFELILLSLPTVIWYAMFSYLPLLGLVLAFKRYTPKRGVNAIVRMFTTKTVGLKNFEFLFASTDAATVFRNTILYNVVFIVLGVVIPVTLAIMASNLYSQKLGKICQTAMFLPHFMSWVVASYFLFAFISPDKGIINGWITSLGGTAVDWYTDSALGAWPFILVIMQIWKTTGYGMVVYLASITGISSEFYEAAVIDGASKWQQTKYITIPLLRQIIAIMTIMAVGKIFNSDFGLFYQVPKNQGPLYPATETLDVYIYIALTRTGDIGMSSAAALFQSVAGCITILIANFVVTKIDAESSFF